jgi:para-nitrobenzyl esterase
MIERISKVQSASGIILGILVLGAMMCGCGGGEPKTNPCDEQQLQVGDSIAIAQTQYGRVQGFILRNIYNFRGIPYGASTAGKNRFMPPQKPEPWRGYASSLVGQLGPQIMDNRYATPSPPLSITGTTTT